MTVIPPVQVVHHVLEELDGRPGPAVTPVVEITPIAGVEVFDDLDPSIGELRKEDIETGPLVPAMMRPIVQDQVEGTELGIHPGADEFRS